MRGLLLAMLLAGCAPAVAAAPTPSHSEGRPTDDALHKAAYARATALAVDGHLDAAIAQLEPIANATATRDDTPLAYWIHNELTWLRWGKGDNLGALAETAAGARALDRSKLAQDEIAAMRLHALWDRAYLLREIGDAGARQAFADYEALARAKDDHDGLAVLTAFFAAREHRVEDAALAARAVDAEKDDDLQDLYVIALALEAGGDRERADALRHRICAAKPYLMKPLIVAQLAREHFVCR